MFEKLQKARQQARERGELRRLLDDCRKLLTERGESNSVAIATRVIERYRALPADAVHALFTVLAAEFDPMAGGFPVPPMPGQEFTYTSRRSLAQGSTIVQEPAAPSVTSADEQPTPEEDTHA